MTIPSFHDLADEDQAELRRTVAALLRQSGEPNLGALCTTLGMTPADLWQEICRVADVIPCTMPVYIQVAGDSEPKGSHA
jgi:hypothetical protein